MKTTGKNGKRYNIGSEKAWAEWQVPPVICPACGNRVRLKDSFFGSFKHGTFHAGCAPYVVETLVYERMRLESGRAGLEAGQAGPDPDPTLRGPTSPQGAETTETPGESVGGR